MNVKLIGIGHKARQGKLLAAKAVHLAAPGESWIFSLADALKAYCRANGWMTKKDSRLLQVFGSDVVRRAHPNRWFEVLEQGIEEFAGDYGVKVALVPDVRFPNEVDWIHRNGGVVWKVERVVKRHVQFPSGLQEVCYVDPSRDASHPSETALDDYQGWDAVLRARDGDVAELSRQAVEAYHRAVRG